MGINFLLPIIAGIVMTIMVGAQVAPSIVDNIKAKKVEYATINNQDIIYEATKRYITLTQTNPSHINDLINGGFLDSTKNNNGFGGTYTIAVDGTKGLLTVTTTIADTKAQQLFLKSFNNKNVPTQLSGTNNFQTKYVLPTDIMHGSGLFMNGIPVQATAPDKIKYKYWYDSFGPKVILKMSDGTNWKEVQLVGDDNVKLSGNQTIAGVKTFSSSPIVPTPTTNTQVANKKYVDDKANGGIGVGQTWQNVTASRNFGVTYTNNTGKPIMVNVTALRTSHIQEGYITATVGSIIIDRATTSDGISNWYHLYNSVSFIVPNNTTYSISSVNSTKFIWSELR